MTPLVSILIPVYNAEPWVAQTLESALSQTWPRTEIIAVNDGSTDNSLAVLRKFEPRGIKVINQENGGAGRCRNRALQEAQGDFLQYLDADDLLSPNKIEAQVKALLSNAPNMVAFCGTMYFWDGEDPDHGMWEDDWPVVNTDDPLAWQIDLLGPDGKPGMVQTGAWLTPRAVAEAAGLWDEYPSPDDDAEYFSRIVLHSVGLRRVEEVVNYYRKHRTGLSQKVSPLHQLGLLRTLDLRSEHILSRDGGPRAKRALASAYMSRAFSAYPDHPEVSQLAVSRAKALGGDENLLQFGSPRSRLINHLFGWRCARTASVLFHRHLWRGRYM